MPIFLLLLLRFVFFFLLFRFVRNFDQQKSNVQPIFFVLFQNAHARTRNQFEIDLNWFCFTWFFWSDFSPKFRSIVDLKWKPIDDKIKTQFVNADFLLSDFHALNAYSHTHPLAMQKWATKKHKTQFHLLSSPLEISVFRPNSWAERATICLLYSFSCFFAFGAHQYTRRHTIFFWNFHQK